MPTTDDFPYSASAEERRAYYTTAQRPKLTPEQQAIASAEKAASDARRMYDIAYRNPSSNSASNLRRLKQQAEEFESRVDVLKTAAAKRQKTESDPAYKNALEHWSAFERTNPNPDRANTAKAILDAYDVDGYWAEVEAIEKAHYTELNTKRSDAELKKLKSDSEFARADLAATEAEHRLKELE